MGAEIAPVLNRGDMQVVDVRHRLRIIPQLNAHLVELLDLIAILVNVVAGERAGADELCDLANGVQTGGGIGGGKPVYILNISVQIGFRLLKHGFRQFAIEIRHLLSPFQRR